MCNCGCNNNNGFNGRELNNMCNNNAINYLNKTLNTDLELLDEIGDIVDRLVDNHCQCLDAVQVLNNSNNNYYNPKCNCIR